MSSTSTASDPRLIGWWQVMTVHPAGRPALQPDEFSSEYLRFRADGRFITAGENCTRPRYVAMHGRVDLHWPRTVECSGITNRNPTDVQIFRALDRVQLRDEITYAIDGPLLTLAAGKYRIKLRHVDRPSRPGPPTGSLPETWSPSSTPRAPSSASR